MFEQNSINSFCLSSGTILSNNFKIISKIGIGGMGAVYLAKDLSNDQQVALKILHPEFHKNKEYIERFIREIKLMNSIEHPNVVKTYDIFVEDGLIFFTMEYVAGETLESIIELGELNLEKIIKIFTEICQGLTAIHKENIIHRDLKPANILITEDGTAKITDFGVARPTDSKMTMKGVKIGSAYYMAPELWYGKKPSPETDLYTLGILLFELLTLELPFDGNSLSDLMMKHLKQEPIAPSTVNFLVPKWIDQLTLRLIKKDPAERFVSAEEVISYIQDNKHRMTKVLPIVNPKDLVFIKNEFDQPNIFKKKKKENTIFQLLSSTRVFNELNDETKKQNSRFKSAIIKIPFPTKAVHFIKISPPSKDVIFFGLFLASLQIADAYLTSKGVTEFGIKIEGNPLLYSLFKEYSHKQVLMFTKVLALISVIGLSIVAKKTPWVKNIINTLSCIYLIAAIIPWLYILYLK